MAALDAAIHEKLSTFNMLLDALVKPGHDNGGHAILFSVTKMGTHGNHGRFWLPRIPVFAETALFRLPVGFNCGSSTLPVLCA
jgi:hypothetical protein